MALTGLISGIKRMEIHDGDGLRTTVFFKGCPLKCLWCHNPESIGFSPELALIPERCMACGSCVALCPNGALSVGDRVERKRDLCRACFACASVCPTEALHPYGKRYGVEYLVENLVQDEPFWRSGKGGVTLSGGECLAQPEFATQVAKTLFDRGVSVDIDTCGFVNRQVLEGILPYTDTFLYDLKAIDPVVHKACTGQDNALILKNLAWLLENGARVEIRYPLVTGWNDGEAAAIGEFLAKLPHVTGVKVLKYHNYAASRYESLGMACTLPQTETTPEDMAKAVETLRGYGLTVVNGMGN